MASSAFSMRRLRTATDKFGWGMRVVGPIATLFGAGRFTSLLLRRPARSEVHLRSGPVLEFDYPGQLPPTLLMFGDFIDPEFDFLKLIVRPHWLVVDVGAAIGQFTIFSATCFPDAIVHAFEPSSANVSTLQRNIARNGVEQRVIVHQEALSNTIGTARFQTTPDTWNSRLASDGGSEEGTELVAVNTLDAKLKAIGVNHIDVLKVNVAGFEPEVIMGATQTLAALRVNIIILLLGLASLPHYAAIAELGYRFFYYHPHEQALYEVTQFDEDAVLNHRPWPARHIIAIRNGAVAGLAAARLSIRPAQADAKSADGDGAAPLMGP